MWSACKALPDGVNIACTHNADIRHSFLSTFLYRVVCSARYHRVLDTS